MFPEDVLYEPTGAHPFTLITENGYGFEVRVDDLSTALQATLSMVLPWKEFRGRRVRVLTHLVETTHDPRLKTDAMAATVRGITQGPFTAKPYSGFDTPTPRWGLFFEDRDGNYDMMDCGSERPAAMCALALWANSQGWTWNDLDDEDKVEKVSAAMNKQLADWTGYTVEACADNATICVRHFDPLHDENEDLWRDKAEAMARASQHGGKVYDFTT